MNQTEEIQETFRQLQNGAVILYPTDTIWGLGCSAKDEDAINKLVELKKRPPDKSFIILVDSIEQLEEYVGQLPASHLSYIKEATDPLTVIYSNPIGLSPLLTANDGSIGIRLVRHSFCQQVIAKLNAPLVSTSANVSGVPSPKKFGEISEQIKKNVGYIVNPSLFSSQKSKASKIVKLLEDGQYDLIRA